MLTLVPGAMGGSETYARALARALAARRAIDVTAFVPSIAPDAGEGLPTELVEEYRASATTAGRLRAMTAATLFPAALRLRFDGIDVVHYPLTVPVPPLRARVAVTLHDVQHLDLPGMFPRAERAFRKLAYDRAARRADMVIVPTTFVRERAVELLGLDPGRVRVIHHGVDHDLFRPAGERAGAVPALPGEDLAAQEPRAPARGVRAAPPSAARPPARAHGSRARSGSPAPRASRQGERCRSPSSSGCTGEPRASSSRASTRGSARRPSRRWPAARPSQPPAPDRSRRCAATPPSSSTRTTRRRSPPESSRPSIRADELSRRGLTRAASFTWDASARAHEDAYRATA